MTGIMPSANSKKADRERYVIILSRPRIPENIGMVARVMKNTGFGHLRVVTEEPFGPSAYATAVHAEDVLDRALRFPSLGRAVADCGTVFAAVARHRKNFTGIPLSEALEKMRAAPIETRIGLLFGNERSGLSSDELRFSNHRFAIPQAGAQPSYNLSAAVLLTLFPLFEIPSGESSRRRNPPLERAGQEACLKLILEKLEDKGFVHPRNRDHIRDRLHDLLGRLDMTAADRDLLLAMFGKGIEPKREEEGPGAAQSDKENKHGE